MKKKSIAVIGVGSAGIQTLAQFLPHFPDNWEIYSIHNPNTKTLGIGESSNPSFLGPLSKGMDFDITRDIKEIDGSLKFGTEYIGWREHDFRNPFLEGSIAIHFSATKLKDFAINRFKKLWGNKFIEILGNVELLENHRDYVRAIVDGKEYTFDYVVDCSGFPKDFSNYIIADNMPINHGIVFNNTKKENDPFGPHYTKHIVSKNGWIFEIPLTTRTSYGYLFNDHVTSVEDAKNDFCNFLNIKKEELGSLEYKFNPYYAKTFVEGRIFKNGNQVAFFEPMFGNSLRLYFLIGVLIQDLITNQKTIEEVERQYVEWTTDIEYLINYHYLGGSTIESDFWKMSKYMSDKKIKNYPKMEVLSILLKQQRNRNQLLSEPQWFFNPQSLMCLNDNFGYTYFSNEEKI